MNHNESQLPRTGPGSSALTARESRKLRRHEGAEVGGRNRASTERVGGTALTLTGHLVPVQEAAARPKSALARALELDTLADARRLLRAPAWSELVEAMREVAANTIATRTELHEDVAKLSLEDLVGERRRARSMSAGRLELGRHWTQLVITMCEVTATTERTRAAQRELPTQVRLEERVVAAAATAAAAAFGVRSNVTGSDGMARERVVEKESIARHRVHVRVGAASGRADRGGG